MVAYISMAFGNPYGDPWNEEQSRGSGASICELGIAFDFSRGYGRSCGAGTDSSSRARSWRIAAECEVGIHLHSTRAAAAAKVLAAFDAGCRRFDSAIGGLGGCPFAQDELVGNIPTEEVIRALEQRGVKLPIQDSLGAASWR